jgi:RNA polymerase primary sigma factor
MAIKESEDMKKLLRAQAKEAAAKELTKVDEEMFENDSETETDSMAKAPEQVTEIAKAVMAAKEPALANGKIARSKAAREGKNSQARDPEKATASLELEARRLRLKNLIVQGKERGYLTYAEINDHLPDDMLDAEQIENIISMINDVGISVYDEAPDAETLLMSETAPTVADEDVVEEAEAALSTVDSEFGRTTDPFRMYIR